MANAADFQPARVASPDTDFQTKSAHAPPPPEITARRLRAGSSICAPQCGRAHRRQPAALAREGWLPAVPWAPISAPIRARDAVDPSVESMPEIHQQATICYTRQHAAD